MIFDTIDYKRISIHSVDGCTHVGIQFGLNVRFDEFLPVLGAEDEVDVYLCEGLGHGGACYL